MGEARPPEPRHWLRKAAYHFIQYPYTAQSYFDWFILILILGNSLVLAINSPDKADDAQFQKIYSILEIVFLTIFGFEAIVKLIALGLFRGKFAYFRSGWNILDFSILIISIMAFTPFAANYSGIRALRVLRPLRTLNGQPSLRLIVQGIFSSFRGLANVLALSIFILIVAALLGVFFWKELLQRRCVILDDDGSLVPEKQLAAYFASLHYNLSYTMTPLPASPDPNGYTFTPAGLPRTPTVAAPPLSQTATAIIETIAPSSLTKLPDGSSTMVPPPLSYTPPPPSREMAGGRWPYPANWDVSRFALADGQEYPVDEEEADGQFCSIHAHKAPWGFAGRACVDDRLPCHKWRNPESGIVSFDNVIAAILVVFQCITIEGWVEVMYMVQDAWSFWAWMWFIIVTFLLSYVMLNLSLAVIIEHYSDNGVTNQVIYRSTDDTIRVTVWTHADESSLRVVETDDDTLMDPTWLITLRYFRSVVTRMVNSTPFNVIIMIIICLNTIMMAAHHHDMDKGLADFIALMNDVFAVIFGVEFVTKMIALGPIAYVRDRFNILDGGLVVASVAELLFNGGNSINVLRSFRLIRLVKLLRNFPSLRQLLEVLMRSVQDTGFLNVILVLYCFVAGLVGMNLFGGTYGRFDPKPRQHFDDIGTSVLTVFQVLTRDDWVNFMWDAMRAVNPILAGAYFLTLVVVGDFVILNLFLAILIKAFSEHQDANMLRLEVQAGRERLDKSLKEALATAGDGDGSSNDDDELLAAARGQVHVKIAERGLLSPDAIGWAAVQKAALDRAREIASLVPHEVSSKRIAKYRDAYGSEVVTVERDLVRGFANSLLPLSARANYSDTQAAGAETGGAASGSGLSPPTVDRSMSKLARLRGPVPAFIRVANAARIRPTFTNGNSSLFIFGPNHPFRVMLWELINWWLFDKMILFLVCVTTLLLAIENPQVNHTDEFLPYASYIANMIITSVFVLEMIFKIIARGFVLHPGAYLRDPWDVLDFVIVIISSVSLMLVGMHLSPVVRFIRAFRALRPLRILNRVSGLRMVVLTLFRALPGIGNVVVVAVLVYAVFAILATNQFDGYAFYCAIDQPLEHPCVQYKFQCQPDWTYNDVIRNCTGPGFPGRNCTDNCIALAEDLVDGDLNHLLVPVMYDEVTWAKNSRDFDNFFASLLSLFEISSLEYWASIMYMLVDSSGDHEVPMRDRSPLFPAMFVVIFIVVANFFTLNLFVGVVIFNYNVVKRRMDNQPLFVTEEQQNWQDMHQMMLKFSPQLRPARPRGRLEGRVYDLVSNRPFDIAVSVLILMNVGTLISDHADSSATYRTVIEVFDVFFMIVFSLEALLKIIAYRFLYFKDSWNVFDFFLVVLGFAANIGTLFDSLLPVNPSALQVLRVFRIMRVIRLAKQLKNIRVLVETLVYSLPALGNMGAFVLLVYMVFAIFGMNIFAGVRGPEADYHANFDTFASALLVLFRCTTGEVWNQIMHDMMIEEPLCEPGNPINNCPASSTSSPFYFVLFLILSTYIMFNLFVAIILDNFNVTVAIEKTTLRMTHLVLFKEQWSKFDPGASYVIPSDRFAVLLRELGPPLGLKAKHRNNRRHLLIKCTEYSIPEHMGHVHFAECLISLARATMGVKMSEREILDQEVVWRQYFSDLAKMPVVTFRSKRTSIDHYLAVTIIAAWYRGWKVRMWYKRVKEAKAAAGGLRRLPGYVVRSSAAIWLGMRTSASSAHDVAGVHAQLSPDAENHPFLPPSHLVVGKSVGPAGAATPKSATERRASLPTGRPRWRHAAAPSTNAAFDTFGIDPTPRPPAPAAKPAGGTDTRRSVSPPPGTSAVAQLAPNGRPSGLAPTLPGATGGSHLSVPNTPGALAGQANGGRMLGQNGIPLAGARRGSYVGSRGASFAMATQESLIPTGRLSRRGSTLATVPREIPFNGTSSGQPQTLAETPEFSVNTGFSFGS